MIDVKTAVKSAISFFVGLMTDTGTKIKDVRVEEVELAEGGNVWEISLSYIIDSDDATIAEAVGSKPRREYKKFEVFADDAKIRAMKIPEIAF